MATAATRLLTYEEWLVMPPVEDGIEEVVKGELRFMAPTRQPHGEILQRLTLRLGIQVDENRVNIFGSNVGVMISRDPLTCRSPDLVMYRREKRVVRDGIDWSAPGLIVEVLSPSETRRRKEEKLADYAAIGTPEVWLISPEAETIEVLLLKNGKLERSAVLADGSLQPSQFAEVSISVSEIFPA
jgi:Uma2 family endonuclease